MEMDVAAVDNRSATGWVFGTFAFDSNFTPADRQAGKKLMETTISDQASRYAASHLGWAGRANGPVDNPISGCVSCHGTAPSPAAPTTFTNACTTDALKMFWFRDLKGTQPFGAVDASCNPINSGPAAEDQAALLDPTTFIVLARRKEWDRFPLVREGEITVPEPSL
jgi:hypothetical protein